MERPKALRLFRAFVATSLIISHPLAGLAQPVLDMNPFRNMRQQQQPIQLPPKAAPPDTKTLPHVSYPFVFVQPVPLKGLNIAGLSSKALELLGFNYFVVVDNTPYNTMAELYRDNRLRGKSNIVTADSIIHPYFAFTNRVLIDVINQHITPDLQDLLKAMLHTSMADYRKAEDKDVKGDIEKNIAFLTVGLKLLDPAYIVSPLGKIPQMVKADIDSIQKGGFGESEIADQPEDFSAYKPLGWYASTPELQNFFRCREWVSRMSYPLSDAAIGATKGSSFRRSVLLYRSMELATIKDQPAYDVWSKLMRAWPLLGPPIAVLQDKTISAQEYKAVLKQSSSDLKVTLAALAEPLFRAKLMLSMRKQKPLGLGSTSIFDLQSAGKSAELVGSFRLLPVTGDPELPWLRAATRVFQNDEQEYTPWPLALVDLHAWGGGEANNLLSDNLNLDTKMFMVLPDLEKCTMRKLPGGQLKTVEDRRWEVLGAYFTFPQETAPQVFRTEPWMIRRLESAFAGWVDSHLAVAPADDAAPPPAASTPQPSATSKQFRRPAYHYLEPNPDIYKKINADAAQIQENLTALGYMQEKYKGRFSDFARLSQRLQKIAETELKSEPLSLADQNLLGNIDMVLEKVEAPVVGTMALNQPLPTDKTPRGVNFSLGRPGQLYMILKQGDKSTLARGAVFTYFETPGAPISAEHWKRKVDFSLLKPPIWTDKVDIVQDKAPPIKQQPVASATARREEVEVVVPQGPKPRSEKTLNPRTFMSSPDEEHPLPYGANIQDDE